MDPNSTSSSSPSLDSYILDWITILVGALVMLTNSLLFYQMYTRRCILKAKRYIFLANVAIGDFLAGLLLVISAVALCSGADGIWAFILPIGTCFNVTLAMCNYSCSMIVQFIALRYPIYYKISLTNIKIFLIILSCWILALFIFSVGFAGSWMDTFGPRPPKIFDYYPHLEVVLKYVYVIGNTTCFLYTLMVAGKRRYRQQGSAISQIGQTNAKPYKAYLQHYGPLLTAGLRLVVYLAACLPLTVHATMGFVMEQGESQVTQSAVYAQSVTAQDEQDEQKVPGVLSSWVCLVWFARGIADPVITLTREKALALGNTADGVLTRQTTKTTVCSKLSADGAK